MSRLRRKDIKRDEVLESFGRTVNYLREHARGILGIVIGVVVVVLLVTLFFFYRGRQATKANRQLAEALQIHSAPVDAANPRPDDAQNPSFADEASRDAGAVEAFTKVYEGASGTPIGGVAAAYLGDLAAAAGDLEGAETLWREALAESRDSLLAGKLQLSLISLSKGRGDLDALVEELRGFLSSGSGALPEDVVLFELAKALDEAGRSDEAQGTYERLVEEHGTSPYAAEARQKLGEL